MWFSLVNFKGFDLKNLSKSAKNCKILKKVQKSENFIIFADYYKVFFITFAN